MKRRSGVLLHISSLPNEEGIGTFGKEARDFVDFLASSNQTYWQILPLNQTGIGDSPYQSFSTFAGNPYFIDLKTLVDEGFLGEEDIKSVSWNTDRVDYEKLYKYKYPLLRKAVDSFFNKNDLDEYNLFVQDNDWLKDYASYMTIKRLQGDIALADFDASYKKGNHDELLDFKEYRYHVAMQFFFFKQWFSLKEYANQKGIKIIGDCPIYVSCDSADVYSNPELFMVDEELKPTKVAGVPPDAFSSTGQLWGNPLYDWEKHKEENYKWWKRRINHLLKIYDYLRIDHFRGLESYFAIDYGDKDAINGVWLKGPGKEFIDVLKEIAPFRIVAEDLGVITDEVRELLKYSGFPGMRVLEFGFNDKNRTDDPNMPENFSNNLFAYAGTHDNDTINGWVESLNKDCHDYLNEYLNFKEGDEYNWKLLEVLFNSEACTVIAQAQDLLGLGSEGRMNKPSTIGDNWKWRYQNGDLNDILAKRLSKLTLDSKRGRKDEDII